MSDNVAFSYAMSQKFVGFILSFLAFLQFLACKNVISRKGSLIAVIWINLSVSAIVFYKPLFVRYDV